MARKPVLAPWATFNIDGSDPLARGLTMWMPLNDGAGTLTQEITGWGQNRGTFVSSAAWTVGGPFGKCLNLPGAGYVTIPSSTFVGPVSGFSLSVWVKVTNFSGYNGLITKTTSSIANPFDWYLASGSGVPSLYLGDGSSFNNVNATNSPASGIWQHLGVTGSLSGSTWFIIHYLNGSVNNGNFISLTPTNGSSSCIIGNRGDAFTQMNGLMADARIYNRPLLPSEMLAIYQNPWRPYYFPRIIRPSPQVSTVVYGWLGTLAQPLPRARVAQQPAALVAPVQQPIPPAPSWLAPVAPSRIDGRRRSPEARQPYLAIPDMQPVAPVYSWLPPVAPSAIPGPVFRVADQQAFAAPDRQPDAPLYGWLPTVAPAMLRPPLGVRQFDIAAPAMQPVPHPSSWLSSVGQPIAAPRRPQDQETLVAPAQQPVPPVYGWLPASQPPPRAPLGLPAAMQQHTALPPGQPVPAWGWEARGPGQFPGARPIQLPGAVGALYFDPPPPAPDFGWFRPAAEPSPHRAFRAFLYGGATLLYAPPPPPIILARPGRVLPLMPDLRALLLAPDIRAIIIPPDEAPMPPVAIQNWSPAAGLDSDFYWLSLYQWLPPEDTVQNPSASISGGPANDATPLEVVPGSVIIDEGYRTVYVPPGVPFNDPGPRIQMQLSGGTRGCTYTVTVTWEDSQGRTINRQAQLFIQWP